MLDFKECNKLFYIRGYENRIFSINIVSNVSVVRTRLKLPNILININVEFNIKNFISICELILGNLKHLFIQ